MVNVEDEKDVNLTGKLFDSAQEQNVLFDENQVYDHRGHTLIDTYDLYTIVYLLFALLFLMGIILLVMKIFCCDFCRKKTSLERIDTKKKEK